MWVKSVLQFASNNSQNYVFRATDHAISLLCKYFKRLLQTGICLCKIEYLMDRDGWSSPHINTGHMLTRISCFKIWKLVPRKLYFVRLRILF
jgi:hypothetical protein